MLIIKHFRGKLLITGFICFTGMFAFAQQEQDYILLLPINEITNRNAFFNRKDINPAQINDTARLDAYWISHKEVGGYIDSPHDNLFSISGNIFGTRSLYGVEFESYKNGGVKKQTFKLIYGYKFRLNENSNIKAAASFGFDKFSLQSNSWFMQGFIVENDWGQSPCASAGATYNWLNHNFGISYLDFLKSYFEYQNINYDVSNKVITANYFSTFKLSRNFKVSPELILANYSGITKIILKGEILYRKNFTIGLIYGQLDYNFGIMSKCLLFNRVELGYLLEKVKNSSINAGSYAHNFKLGFILK